MLRRDLAKNPLGFLAGNRSAIPPLRTFVSDGLQIPNYRDEKSFKIIFDLEALFSSEADLATFCKTKKVAGSRGR